MIAAPELELVEVDVASGRHVVEASAVGASFCVQLRLRLVDDAAVAAFLDAKVAPDGPSLREHLQAASRAGTFQGEQVPPAEVHIGPDLGCTWRGVPSPLLRHVVSLARPLLEARGGAQGVFGWRDEAGPELFWDELLLLRGAEEIPIHGLLRDLSSF